MTLDQDQFHELSYYTLAHRDGSFIHQHVVDAFSAQHADETTKPIEIVFALIGLYLHVEKGFTGKQVQKAHMQLAKQRKQWFRPELPHGRGVIGIADVLGEDPGPARDAMIHRWCVSVWEAWAVGRSVIVELSLRELGVK
jgi:hypothetical protein